MADRLTQIWKGFAGTTQARLTSSDIRSQSLPPVGQMREERRRERAALDEGREDASDAVQAAFQALHADIQRKSKRGRRDQASFDAEPPAPPASALDDRLLADLKFTEARVRRSSSDYIAYATERQANWKKRRKKFLGIF
ncbi:MAG: hypothetical protein AAF830_09025 [Pseudomonadota bacterium]